MDNKLGKLLFVLLWLQFFTSCNKNQNFKISVQTKNNFTIEQAQALYGKETVQSVTLKSGILSPKTIGIKPDWCDSFESQNDQIEVVEVGLFMQGGFSFADDPSYQDWKTTKNGKMLSSLTRLVFLKHKDDGRIEQFLMTIFGNKDFNSNHANRIKLISYLSRDENFSGNILYHDLAGNFINGWKYEKGNLVAQTTQTSGEGLHTQLKMASTVCGFVTYYTLYEQCTDWYKADPENPTEFWYTNTTCEYYEVPTQFLECQSYFTSIGSGGVPGGYIVSSPVLSTSLARLFKNGTTLEGNDLTALNNAYYQLLADCLSAHIDALLKSQNISLNKIRFDSGMYGDAAFTNLGDLLFRNSDQISMEKMAHEWIHMYQNKIVGNNIFDPLNQGMAEFEINLINDIKEYVRIHGNLNLTTYSWSCFYPGSTRLQNDYVLWLSSLTNSGSTYPSSINSSVFRDWALKWGNFRSLPYNFSSTTYVPTAANQLLSYSINCLN